MHPEVFQHTVSGIRNQNTAAITIRYGLWSSHIGPKAAAVGARYGDGCPAKGECEVRRLRGRTENMWRPDGHCQKCPRVGALER